MCPHITVCVHIHYVSTVRIPIRVSAYSCLKPAFLFFQSTRLVACGLVQKKHAVYTYLVVLSIFFPGIHICSSSQHFFFLVDEASKLCWPLPAVYTRKRGSWRYSFFPVFSIEEASSLRPLPEVARGSGGLGGERLRLKKEIEPYKNRAL